MSLPVPSVANSLVRIALGVLVFGENPSSGALALSGEALGPAVIVASVTILAPTAARTSIRLLSPVHGGQQSWPVLPARPVRLVTRPPATHRPCPSDWRRLAVAAGRRRRHTRPSPEGIRGIPAQM